MMTGVAEVEDIEDGLVVWPHRVAASKAFNKSRPRRLRRPRHLMCLVLPEKTIHRV